MYKWVYDPEADVTRLFNRDYRCLATVGSYGDWVILGYRPTGIVVLHAGSPTIHTTNQQVMIAAGQRAVEEKLRIQL